MIDCETMNLYSGNFTAGCSDGIVNASKRWKGYLANQTKEEKERFHIEKQLYCQQRKLLISNDATIRKEIRIINGAV